MKYFFYGFLAVVCIYLAPITTVTTAAAGYLVWWVRRR